jgi:hemoglobin-like flavoprotein
MDVLAYRLTGFAVPFHVGIITFHCENFGPRIMTHEQLSAIRISFDKARSVSPDFGAKFYHCLTNDFPEIMSKFDPLSMRAQHTRFVGMLDMIIFRMYDKRPVKQLLQGLGDRHDNYGVQDEDFAKFSITLLKILDGLLGNELNESLSNAWVELLGEIRTMMRPCQSPVR